MSSVDTIDGTPKVFVVMLRRPRVGDSRSDPYYEFGSFGLTGCHSKNLLHPERAQERLNNSRLAFVQGGDKGLRLICLTPPVTVVRHPGNKIEVLWRKSSRRYQFLRYDSGVEILEIPGVERIIAKVNRSKPMAKFSSKFRTSVKPLDENISKALEKEYRKACQSTNRLASRYDEALPKPIDDKYLEKNRKVCLAKWRQNAGVSADSLRTCQNSKPRRGTSRC